MQKMLLLFAALISITALTATVLAAEAPAQFESLIAHSEAGGIENNNSADQHCCQNQCDNDQNLCRNCCAIGTVSGNFLEPRIEHRPNYILHSADFSVTFSKAIEPPPPRDI
jgi:hypothetical protein